MKKMTSKEFLQYLETHDPDSNLTYYWIEFPDALRPYILELYPEVEELLEKEIILVKPLDIILFPIAHGIYDPLSRNKEKEQWLINELIGE
jgi:hypothetical protein